MGRFDSASLVHALRGIWAGTRINTAAIYFSSSLIARGMAFFSILLFENLMSDTHFEEWAFFLLFKEIYSVLLLQGGPLFRVSEARYGAARRRGIQGAILKVNALAFTIAAALHLCAIPFIDPGLLIVSMLGLLNALFWNVRMCYFGYAIMRTQPWAYAALELTYDLGLIVLFLLLYTLMPVASVNQALSASAVMSVALLVYLWFWARSLGMMEEGVTRRGWVYVLRRLLAFTPANAAVILSSTLDRLLVVGFVGQAALADFTLARQMTQPIGLLTQNFIRIVTPALYGRLKTESGHTRRRSMHLFSISAALLIALTTLATLALIWFAMGFITRETALIKAVVPFFVLSSILVSLTSVYSNVSIFFGLYADLARVSLIGLAVNGLVALLTLELIGPKGIAFGAVAAATVVLLLTIRIAFRRLRSAEETPAKT